MALGGGVWSTQNKVLPGTYIKKISKSLGKVQLSERGYASIPIELDWGIDGEIFKVTADRVNQQSEELFGYRIGHEKLTLIREIFKNAREVYFYRINSGEKAKSELGEARYSGIRGNDIRVVISKSIDIDGAFIVSTYLGNDEVDSQLVSSREELKDNKYVIFSKELELSENAGVKFEGGTNLDKITVAEYEKYLRKVEGLGINTLGCPVADEDVVELFVAFTKRMRDDVGAFFQTVVHAPEKKFNYEGVINLENKCITDDYPESAGVYWLTGAEAGVAINKSLTNDAYDGELRFDVDYTQYELEDLMNEGMLVFHRVDDEIKVLKDVNTYIKFSELKGESFNSNQVMRVIDGKGLELVKVFNNEYLGHVNNDNGGRVSLWSKLVDINRQYQDLRAITDFVPDDIVVEEGDDRESVLVQDSFTPNKVMTKLYATFVVTE